MLLNLFFTEMTTRIVSVALAWESLLQREDPFDIVVFLAVPGITALATTAAVVVSLGVSLSARRQAKKTEMARIRAEAARGEDQRLRRVSSALGMFLTELPEHVIDIAKHDREMEEYPALLSAGRYQGIFPPMKPSTVGLLTRLAVAELDAAIEERDFLNKVKNVVAWTSDSPLEIRTTCLRFLPTLIVDWMRGDVGEREDVTETLELLAESKQKEESDAFVREYKSRKRMKDAAPAADTGEFNQGTAEETTT